MLEAIGLLYCGVSWAYEGYVKGDRGRCRSGKKETPWKSGGKDME